MTDQYYKNPDETSEIIGEIDKDTTPETIESDSFADRTPVDESLINDTPMGGTVASVEPLSGPLPDEIELFETPNQEIPMGGTLAAAGPMDETIVNEEPFEDVIVPQPQVLEPNPDEAWESKIDKSNLYNEPKDETIDYEASVDEVVFSHPQVVEPNPDETWENKIGKLNLYNEPKDETLVPVVPLVDESLINDTPMGGTVASVEPRSGPLPDEVHLFGTPNQQIPMGGTIAAVGPMDETMVNEAPFEDVIVPQPQVVEPNPDETWENKIGKLNLYNESKDETVVPVVPFVDNVPSPSLADESLPEETLENKINNLDPCDDPADELLRQKEHVATTGGLAN